MGFDIFGENGDYFRSNVWWWHRLADFVVEHVKLSNAKSWHYNDGVLVNKEKASEIAEFLKKAVKEKENYAEWVVNNEKEYIEMSRDMNKAMGNDKEVDKCLYPFSWENVEEFATFCENSGGFRIC